MKKYCWETRGDHKVNAICSDTKKDQRNIAVFVHLGQSRHRKILQCEELTSQRRLNYRNI